MALSRVVEADQITIQVETTLRQIIAGEIEAIAIQLQQFLVRQNLTVARLQLQIGRVTVSPRDARRGKILLLQPATGVLIIAIAAQALSQALFEEVHSQFSLRDQSPHNSIQSPHNSIIDQVSIVAIECSFTEVNSILIQVQWLPSLGGMRQAMVTLIPDLCPGSARVELITQNFEFDPLPDQVLAAIQTSLVNILNLRDFTNRGTEFEVQSIAIANQQLVLHANAEIFEFPSQ
ncbi:MAG: hypothetical protein NW220_03540 [Leptolyngbyaceae cyanobacterium bins.349]|nr:hypothetical protein [Leptolyngbyaceae cyanobacterium bins.349]